jgi:membrane protease YdiL (CAAX protease family)
MQTERPSSPSVAPQYRCLRFGRVGDVAFTFALVLLIPRISAWGADYIQSVAGSIDPQRLFFRISIHHLFQLALTILLMTMLGGTHLPKWGFNAHQLRFSFKVLGWFCLIYSVQVFLVSVLPDLKSGRLPRFNPPVSLASAAGILAFQFLLSGTCEEPLFRGFVMTFLARSWKETVRIGSLVIPVSGLWATLFFMVAHAEITFNPFSITGSLPQQLLALELGLYYAAVFHRTGSLVGPILSHGYSNGVLYLMLFAGTLLGR